MEAITTEGLTKRFGELAAVDDVSIRIEEGELFGLLGPNGAGKTTFLNMLCTMLRPTAGKARVWGHDVAREPDAVRRAIGVVFQDPSLDIQLTGRENLDFHGRLYGLGAEKRRERIDAVLELVELEDRADDLVKTYSGGMRRRLELARGLMHFPKILFLDEPTLGLDPQTRRRIWEYILKLNREEGITMILTTHYMEEADSLCHRVAIIDKGRIIALDAPRKLKEKVGEDVITVMASEPERFVGLLKAESWAEEVHLADGVISLGVRGGEGLIPRVIDLARRSGIEVCSVGLHKPTLEDVFIGYTGKGIREEKGNARDRIRSIMRAKLR
ncbi:MAG: ATP-binding cassette domain-containing protein [Candidatus Hydrothermarchaeota archaeon]